MYLVIHGDYANYSCMCEWRMFHLDRSLKLVCGLKTGYGARLWDKCFCLMLDVIPFGIQFQRGHGGLGDVLVECVLMCISQRWMIWRQGVFIGFNMCWLQIMRSIIRWLSIPVTKLIELVWTPCCRVYPQSLVLKVVSLVLGLGG